ncbi:MAG: AlpA family phage regulatory protein, partial [Pseudomonadota bacterium]
MAKGKFPKPIPLGARAVGWLNEELENWINERAKLRE